MDLLKKVFPISFKLADTVANLVIGILVYVVSLVVAGAIIALLMWIPFVGILFSLVGSLVSIYCLAGIVIEVLVFTKILQ